MALFKIWMLKNLTALLSQFLSSYLQAFPEAINECLEEGFVVGDCLEDVPICSDVANGPLTQAGAAQAENVTENTQRERNFSLGQAEKVKSQVGSLCLAISRQQITSVGITWWFVAAFLNWPPGSSKGNSAIWYKMRKDSKHWPPGEIKPRIQSKRSSHPLKSFVSNQLSKSQQTNRLQEVSMSKSSPGVTTQAAERSTENLSALLQSVVAARPSQQGPAGWAPSHLPGLWMNFCSLAFTSS